MSRQSLGRRRWNPAALGLFVAAATTLLGGSPAASRAADEADQLKLGRELFVRQWLPNDPRSLAGDGLGPRFNEKSCVACHQQGGIGGAGPVNKNVQILALGNKPYHAHGPAAREFLQLLPECATAPAVLHKFSTSQKFETWRHELASRPLAPGWIRQGMALVHVLDKHARSSSFEADLTGIKNLWMIDGLELRLSERNTPALFGAGLIETIPVAALEAAAAAQDGSIRGRVARLPSGEVGRFGWKAQNSTLLDFTQNACAVELGLENPGHHQARKLMAQTDDAQPDLSLEDCQALAAFQAALPAPQQIMPKLPPVQLEADRGQQVFEQIGCAACHAPNLGSARGIYSDLLLHNMGAKLAGQTYYKSQTLQTIQAGVQEGNAAALSTEWRTPPLWGCSDTAPYMHDGRARTLEDAILMHEQQGRASADAYRQLPVEERRALTVFLHTLHTPRSAEPVPKVREAK